MQVGQSLNALFEEVKGVLELLYDLVMLIHDGLRPGGLNAILEGFFHLGEIPGS